MAHVLARLVLGRAGDAYLPVGHRRRVVLQARLIAAGVGAAVVASVIARSWLIVQAWVVPAVVGQPFLRGYLLAEHTGCPQVPDMLVNTRTTRTNAAVRLLAWNMPFHTEHHVHPQVPFHQLPRLHGVMADEVSVVGAGYVRTYISLQRERWRAATRRAARAHYGGRP
jgi:fatty acid desaturase